MAAEAGRQCGTQWREARGAVVTIPASDAAHASGRWRRATSFSVGRLGRCHTPHSSDGRATVRERQQGFDGGRERVGRGSAVRRQWRFLDFGRKGGKRKGGKEERRKGGEEERTNGGEEERRKRGTEERGEEEREERRSGGKVGKYKRSKLGKEERRNRREERRRRGGKGWRQQAQRRWLCV